MANQERIDIIIGAKDQASKVLQNLKSSIIGIGTAYLSWQAAKTILVDSIKAAIESEKVYDALSDAIDRHGGSWRVVEGRVRAFTSELQRTLGVSDEVVAQGLQKLIDAGMSTAKAMDAMRLATDVAAGAHIDLNSAIDLVAKASVGITRGLTQVNIKLDDSGTAAQKAEAAFKALNEKFGGAAVDAMDTTAGRLQLLSAAFDELQESIGKAFTESESGSDIILRLTQLMQSLTLMIEGQISKWALLRALALSFWSLLSGKPVTAAQIMMDDYNKKLHFTEQGLLKVNVATKDFTNTQAAWLKTQREIIASQDDLTISLGPTIITIDKMAELTQKNWEWVTKLREEWEKSAEGIIQSTTKIEGAVAKVEKDMRSWEEKFADLTGSAKIFAGALHDAIAGSLGNQIAQLEIFKNRAKTVFGQIAQDFITIFIKAVGEALARAIAKWVVMLLFFDKPSNDRKAMESGLDFARHFATGVSKGFNDFLPTSKMVASGGRLAMGGQPSGGNVTINFLGPITNREFVEAEIIPVIEKAISNKKTGILYNRQQITGKAQVAF